MVDNLAGMTSNIKAFKKNIKIDFSIEIKPKNSPKIN
jgi:hypothetical protein